MPDVALELVVMAAGVSVALITAFASLLVAFLSATVSLAVQRRTSAANKDLEQFRTAASKELEELKLARQERAEREKRELEAEAILSRYREPLVAAAYDLQSRIYNILHGEFLSTYGGTERGDEAIKSTLFRFAQYFGWTEILRQDIHSWKFTDDADTRAVGELLDEVKRRFQTDEYDLAFMIWSDEQRAIGELMIKRDDGSKTCLGYARFVEIYDESLKRWLGRLEQNLRDGATANDERLSFVQGELRELVIRLDPQQLRYDHSAMKVSLL